MEDMEIRRKMREVLIQEYRAAIGLAHLKRQRIEELDHEIGDSTDFSEIGDDIGTDHSGSAPAHSGASGIKPKPRPDQFMGMTYQAAAKSYLEGVGHAVTMDELLEALKRGGCPVGGANPKKTLYISLVRSREFVPVPGQSGYIGLRGFYKDRGVEKKGKK